LLSLLSRFDWLPDFCSKRKASDPSLIGHLRVRRAARRGKRHQLRQLFIWRTCRVAISALAPYLRAVPRKQLDVPPAAARAFVKDMRAVQAAATVFERDETAARQLDALRKHLRPGSGGYGRARTFPGNEGVDHTDSAALAR
jgi:hypothetical protein